MKTAILTVGPRWSGKSTFCNQIIHSHTEIVLVSRDAILIELFGSIYLSAYSSGHLVALKKMWEITAEHMQRSKMLMILDCWNGFAKERNTITEKLRSVGAERIIAWYFITPEDVCLKWFMGEIKNEIKGKNPKWIKLHKETKQESYIHDYRLYHSQPVDSTQGFDFIKKINPLEPLPLELLLREEEK